MIDLPKNSLFKIMAKIRGRSLRAKSARGAAILGAGTVTDRGLRFVRNMILARILAPNEFGLMAIVMVWPAVFEAFSQIGVKHSVVQNKRGAEREYLNVAWWVQGIEGLVLFAIGVLTAPLMSSVYGKPELLNLLRVAFLAILFRGFISPRMSVLWKEYKYGKLVLLSMGSGVISTFITIGLAFMIRSVWALVIGFVSDAAILCVLSYAFVPFIPRLGADRERLSELMSFFMGLFGSPILLVIANKSDIVVLGRMVTEDRLGKYSLAVFLANLPVILFDRIIRPVLLPAFSEKQDEKSTLCRALLEISRGAGILGVSVVSFMASCAGGILLLAYGPEYVAVSVPFALLSICALFRIQSAVLVPAYMALGQTRLHRLFIAFQAVIVMGLMYPGIKMFDLPGAASVLLLANIILLCFQVLFMRRLIGLQVLDYVRCWLPGLLAGSIVLGSAALLQVFDIQSVVCNVAMVGLSCVVAYGFVIFALKSNDQAAENNNAGPVDIGKAIDKTC